MPIICTIPDDGSLLEFDMEQRSLLDLPDDSKAVLAIDAMMGKVKEVIG